MKKKIQKIISIIIYVHFVLGVIIISNIVHESTHVIQNINQADEYSIKNVCFYGYYPSNESLSAIAWVEFLPAEKEYELSKFYASHSEWIACIIEILYIIIISFLCFKYQFNKK